ncbi:MAG: ABC transporter ATP-binding protein, partial [Burkholderiales bacterium]
MPDSILYVRGLSKSFGALRACDGIDFDVKEGETHAVIGPNGAGKTTFISQLAGNLRPDAGSVRFAGSDITTLSAPKRARMGLARSFQITSIYPEFSALDNVALAVQAHSGHSFRFWRTTRGDPALTGPAERVLDEVGLQQRKNILAANLSHGEQRQLEVAMALATEPRLLLLDEPMAGMGTEESQRMIALLSRL